MTNTLHLCDDPVITIKVVITTGNAVQPYSIMSEEVFNTSFAAWLYGKMTCEANGMYTYWSIKKQ